MYSMVTTVNNTVLYTGIPHFIVLCFIVVCKYCIF